MIPKMNRLHNNRVSRLETTSFHLPTLPDDILLKIFSSVPPGDKSYWFMTSKTWKQMGTKFAPYVYELYENHSPICASTEDVKFILFNAVWDGKVKVVENILQHSKLRSVIYRLPYYCWWNDGVLLHHWCDPYNIVASKKRYVELSSDKQEDKIVAMNNLSAITDILKEYKVNDYLLTDSIYKDFIAPNPLAIACYVGNENMIKDIMKKDKNFYLSNQEVNSILINVRFARALSIAIERGKLHIVSILCDIIKEDEQFKKDCSGMWLFDTAASLDKKDIFELLISVYKADLNKLYHKYELTPMPDGNAMHYTYLDLLTVRSRYYTKHDLTDYVALVKKYGGKTAEEINNEQKRSVFSVIFK